MTEKTKTSGIKSWMNIFKGSKKQVNHDNNIGVTKARTTSSSLSEKDTASSLPTSMTRSSTTTTTQSSVDIDHHLNQLTSTTNDDDFVNTISMNDDDDSPAEHGSPLQTPVKTDISVCDNNDPTSITDVTPTVLPSVKIFWQYGGEEVFVTGNFDDWSKSLKMEKQPNGSFMANIQSTNKTVLYKFVVDGVWKHDDNQPTENDEDGNINNAIQI